MYSCKKDLEEKIMKLLIFTLKFHLKGFTAKNTCIIHKYEMKRQCDTITSQLQKMQQK